MKTSSSSRILGSTRAVACAAAVVVAGACGGAQSPAPAAPSNTEPTPPAPAAPSATSDSAPAPSAAPSGSDDSATPAAGGATETRTNEVIAEIVKAHRKEARKCYEKELKQLPDLKGDLVIHFVLKPKGEVKTVELNRERSTIVAPSVVNCVIDVIRSIPFPPSSRGMESTVNYPFNFNP